MLPIVLIQGFGFRVLGSGFWVQGFGFRVLGSGFRVLGSGFRVQGSGWMVYKVLQALFGYVALIQIRLPQGLGFGV
jgi:hypothetical protein